MAEVILKEMQPVKQFSSMSTPAPAVKLVKKDTLKTKAANYLRNNYAGVKPMGKEILKTYAGAARETGKTIRDIALRHTPIGVAKSGIGLTMDKIAQRKSENALTDLRVRAASALAGANRKNALLK